MAVFMAKFVKHGSKMTAHQRNMVSVSFKQKLKPRREAWRNISAMKNKEELKGNKYLDLIEEMKEKIERELMMICKEVLNLIDVYLLKAASNQEDTVFFLKMRADYNRYIAEISTGDTRDQATNEAEEGYIQARNESDKLSSTHPIRLAVKLNFAVFECEVKNNHTSAISIARNAFESAVQDLASLADADRDDAEAIL